MKVLATQSRKVLVVWLLAALAIWGYNLRRIAGAMQPETPASARLSAGDSLPPWLPAPAQVPFTGDFPDPFRRPMAMPDASNQPLHEGLPDLRLLGVIGQRALLQLDDSLTQIVATGESIGPAVVREIAAGSVRLVVGESTLILTLADEPASHQPTP